MSDVVMWAYSHTRFPSKSNHALMDPNCNNRSLSYEPIVHLMVSMPSIHTERPSSCSISSSFNCVRVFKHSIHRSASCHELSSRLFNLGLYPELELFGLTCERRSLALSDYSFSTQLQVIEYSLLLTFSHAR